MLTAPSGVGRVTPPDAVEFWPSTPVSSPSPLLLKDAAKLDIVADDESPVAEVWVTALVWPKEGDEMPNKVNPTNARNPHFRGNTETHRKMAISISSFVRAYRAEASGILNGHWTALADIEATANAVRWWAKTEILIRPSLA
jgi:hypothetical protein